MAYLWPPMPAQLQNGVLDAIAEFFRLPPGELPRTLMRVGVIWLLAWLVMRVIHLIARRIVAAVDDGDDSTLTVAEKRGQTIAQLLRSVGRVVVLGLTALLTLDVFFDIGPLLAGAGILGLAVSFGAQSLVKDVIGGFFILLENQFVVGDVVEAAGKSGTVERMTLRVVMLRDLRGVLHIIPNGQIAAVSNFTRSWSRAVVEVSVAYSANVDHAIAVLQDEAGRFVADAVWQARLEGAPDVLGVEQLGENGVTIRALLRTVPGAQWEVGREFRRRIKNRLDREGIEMSYPQRVVHLRQAAGPTETMRADQGEGE